ncbi:transposase, MuDR [Artemisia annua]|uniref:Transposase, MuDR n=1 Tax=Artemisia annua TaxID=35608 RepID=A0A2U1KXU6_ARTAN|nr:transposase, MuDR [Artemisia annua]
MLLCQWVLRPDGRTFDPYQVYSKFPTVFSLEIHHGGYFTRPLNRVYIDGKVSWFDQIDADGFSIVEVKSMLAGLGYKNPNMQFSYKRPNGNLDSGLYVLNSDSDVLGLIKHVDKCKLIELYVTHPVDIPKITEPNEVGNLEDDFDPFFCDLDPEKGESMSRTKESEQNDNPAGSEPNNADGLVSDHSKQSDASEESDDSDGSEDSNFAFEGENNIDDFEVDMEDFRKHTDPNVEWVGCNEAQDEPVEQNEPCLEEEDLEDFGSGTDSDDPECNRKRALKKLANQHKPVDGKFYSDNFYVGQSFGNKDLIKEMVTRISVDSRRDIYLTKNDKTRVRAECREVKRIKNWVVLTGPFCR